MSDPNGTPDAQYGVETQRQHFIKFALQLIGDQDPQKDGLLETLASEWDSKSAEIQQTLTDSLSAVEAHHAKGYTALNTAQTLSDRVDQHEHPSRAKLLALRAYHEHLEALRTLRVELANITQVLVDDYITVAEFSATVIELFNSRALKARQEVEDVQSVLDDTTIQIIEMEELPGLNPRKVPYYSDAHGRRLKDAQINRSARQPPLEYDPPISTGNWLPAKSLGGGMSQAFLWVDVDPENGNIRQRVVRKDTPVRRDQWADATKWHGVELRSVDPRSRVPMEYHCQKTVQERPEARYVALALKCEVDVKRLLYRLYLPFYPYGDLHSLVYRYERDELLLPEPLLWRIFEALVETGLIMERGGVEDVPAEGWMQIVHRDLKPANVFLDIESDTTYPRYPTPKLADFGLAIQTWPDDPLNPTIYNLGSGTPGYYPPEQSAYMDIETREPVDEFKLLAHTNVWGVGAIMYSLAHLHLLGCSSNGDELDYLPNGIKELPIGNEKTVLLSQDLLNAIQACMRFDPAKRITFEALHRDIQHFVSMNAKDGGVGQYLQQAQFGVQEENVYFDIFGFAQDEYKIGFAFEGPKWEKQEELSDSVDGGDGSRQAGAGEDERSAAPRRGFRVSSGAS